MSPENAFPANLVLIVFIGLTGSGCFLYFRRHGCTLSESAVYGLMTVLMFQSWIGQLLLMAGATSFYIFFLMFGALPGLKAAPGIPQTLASCWKASIHFARKHPLAVTGLLTVWTYAAVIDAWPNVRLHGILMENLEPLWRHSGSIFTFWRTTPEMALPVLNHLVFTAPWQPSMAMAFANLSAYMIIGFGTYALSRRYAWPPMAITVTLLVVSMPRLVNQSLVAGSELVPAAAALAAILALFRAVERPQAQDLVMLVCSIGFSISGGRLCYLMPMILAGLSLVLLVRRHGARWWGQGGGRQIGVILATAAGVAVFSQAAVVGANLAAGQEWIGAAQWDRVIFNPDALKGTLANLIRYFILAIDLPDVIDRGCRWLFGLSLSGGLKAVYHWTVQATLAGSGAAAPFEWSWTAPHRLVWFGPVGSLLVIPSLFISFWRGPHRLKSTALAVLAYWLMIALIVAWRPENVRLMTRFFVCGGFFMAFAMPPWRLSRNGRILLQLMGILIMLHAILM